MVITREYLEQQGYRSIKQCKNGVWVGVYSMIYTFGLCIGLDEFGYNNIYCYENLEEVLKACMLYGGEGDPSGPWIKRKGEDGEKMGPGAKKE